jgi:hypothetical protein
MSPPNVSVTPGTRGWNALNVGFASCTPDAAWADGRQRRSRSCFWMWVVALVGMATKFSEAALGLKYRHVADDGHVSGGAFYYIERGLGWQPLALLYALLAGVASFGIGNMVRSAPRAGWSPSGRSPTRSTV